MDVPFGWPTALVESVTAHAQQKQLPSFSIQQLRFRVTDHNVKASDRQVAETTSSSLARAPLRLA